MTHGGGTRSIGVIGAGIVGLSVARHLQRTSGSQVTVIDKEPTVAAHQTGHNSNVVHSGVYYVPGSLKARLCRHGRQLLHTYCLEHRLPYEVVGKVIVAVRDDEVGRLHGLADRAQKNGIHGSLVIGSQELREREPHVRGLAALWVPDTAVVDFRLVAEHLASDAVEDGAEIILGHPVTSVDVRPDEVRICTGSRELAFDHLVVCAGLQSSQVARMAGAEPDPEIVPFRGEYYELTRERSDLVHGLVYPVPDPRYPFLGVHFTRGIAGHVHVGPNAVLAMAREGYRWRDVRLDELRSTLAYPGMRRLARRHWRMGFREICGSLSKSIFLRRCRAYIPELERADLVRSGAGVRAQALGPDGDLVDDFVIEHRQRMTLVRNAPSPAATAALAIAEHVVREMTENNQSR